MAQFRVDSDEMQAAVQATHASMDAVRSEVAGLLGRLSSLQASWGGTASASFQVLVDDWRAAQQRVEESMTRMNQTLGSAASTYSTVEADVQRMFAA